MKTIPFTVEFVSTLDTDKYDHIPNEVLEKICKEGLVELIAPRLAEINEGGTWAKVELVK